MSLEARGVVRRFGDQTPVDGVDLDLRPGEVFGLIGPNGGGKSTLLLLLAGLIEPSAGTVALDGTPTVDLARTAQGTVGLITAEPGLYPLLTGRENLHFFGGLYGLASGEVDARCQALLDELELGAEALDQRTGVYSSGMRQKVSLVRALMLRPAVLLLDEPTANLDPLSSHTLHAVVRRCADDGVAAAIATHDLHAASHICDRVAVMDRRLGEVHELTGERVPPPEGALHALLREADW